MNRSENLIHAHNCECCRGKRTGGITGKLVMHFKACISSNCIIHTFYVILFANFFIVDFFAPNVFANVHYCGFSQIPALFLEGIV